MASRDKKGSQPEGPLLWSQLHGEGSPQREALSSGEEVGVRAEGRLLPPPPRGGATSHFCSMTLYEILKTVVFFSFFDQRPPGSVPAVLMGFQPALALTGALCLQQVLSTHHRGHQGRGAHIPSWERPRLWIPALNPAQKANGPDPGRGLEGL